MAVRLNHTIVSARDHSASARFLSELLGLSDPVHLGPFAVVQIGDPSQKQRGQVNEWDGGRGVYWSDPNGNLLEIITRPYGTGGSQAPKPHPLLKAPKE